MPSLILTPGEESFSWQIIELGSPFNTSNYIAAGITVYKFTEGGVTTISGTVSEIDAPASRTAYYTPEVEVSDYAPGTYTFWAWCQALNGKYYPAGSATVTVTSSSDERPWDWIWDSDIYRNGEVGLTASEWVDFCDRINEFRRYKGLDDYDFTVPVAGKTKISAAICNEAWEAIDDIPGSGTMPDEAVAGEPLVASFFLGLRNALNEIP